MGMVGDGWLLFLFFERWEGTASKCSRVAVDRVFRSGRWWPLAVTFKALGFPRACRSLRGLQGRGRLGRVRGRAGPCPWRPWEAAVCVAGRVLSRVVSEAMLCV